MNLEEAKIVIKSTKEVLISLGDLLEVVNSINENEFRTDFQRAIGVSLIELDMEILGPLYRKFSDLNQEERFDTN